MLSGMSTIEIIENLKIKNLTENRVIRCTVGQNATKVRQKSFSQLLNSDIFWQVYES